MGLAVAIAPNVVSEIARISVVPERRRALTERQQLVLSFIGEYLDTHGFPPTLREIGVRMGIRSTNGVNDHLKAIERKGFIRRSDMVSRGIVVVDRPEVSPPPMPSAAIEAWKAENIALRDLLRRIQAAGRRMPTLTAEMVVILGDVRDVLATRDSTGGIR